MPRFQHHSSGCIQQRPWHTMLHRRPGKRKSIEGQSSALWVFPAEEAGNEQDGCGSPAPLVAPRRSRRQRLSPLAFWKNERPEYRYDIVEGTQVQMPVPVGVKIDEPQEPLRKKTKRRIETEILALDSESSIILNGSSFAKVVFVHRCQPECVVVHREEETEELSEGSIFRVESGEHVTVFNSSKACARLFFATVI